MQKRTLVEGLEDRKLMATGVLSVGPSTVYLNAVQGKSATYAVRLTNTGNKFVELAGSAGVRIKGDNPGQFKITDLPSAPSASSRGRRSISRCSSPPRPARSTSSPPSCGSRPPAARSSSATSRACPPRARAAASSRRCRRF